MIRHKENHFEN